MIHVVCGSPCSGKTTYVKEHAGDGAAIIDLDGIAQSMGGSCHASSSHIAKLARSARKAAIDEAMQSEGETYIIHTAPNNDQMGLYEQAGAHIVVLDPGIDEVRARCTRDDRPRGTSQAIDSWYKKANEASYSSLFSYANQTPARGSFSYGGQTPFLSRPAQDTEPAREGESMSEETTQTPKEPHGTEEKDWKAEYEKVLAQSRKWEERSKANAEKAKEFDALQESTKEALERAKVAEKERDALKASEDRRAAVKAVSDETGIPQEVLEVMQAEGEDDLRKKAESIAGFFKRPVAPVVSSDGEAAKPQNTESADEWLRSTIKRH